MANSQMTHKYISRTYQPGIQQREENLFLEEYYSGTDTKVFFNNKEQTEISYISFSLNEQLKPIYGYASRTFDDMAVGNRIVTGVFRIPIKNIEEQDSYETVVLGMSTLEEINNKNIAEETKRNNTEWIIPQNNKIVDDYIIDNIVEYQNKLKELGYNIENTGILDNQTKNIFKEFQKNNNLSFTSERLDNDTMALIDSQIEVKNMPKATVNQELNVYAGMSLKSGIMYKLKFNEEFYLIKNLGEFSLIRTMNGIEGYVETAKILMGV